ncbi:hypothetical protein MKW92_040216 [Papaver armeniacum]|nr:hypothetical protein MKW92_040216 [Papaver armeniacum]
MLSGIKFIPRDQLETDLSSSSVEERRKSSNKKEKRRRKKKHQEYSSGSSSDSESSDSDADIKSHRSRGKNKKSSKKRKNRHSTSSSDSESEEEGRRRKHESRKKERGHRAEAQEGVSDSVPRDVNELARKEAGLDWMLKPKYDPEKISVQTTDLPEEPQVEEVRLQLILKLKKTFTLQILGKETNPRELNPYYKNDGGGFPEDEVQTKVHGGASWRLKALKRAQEQAARDGKVVEERWGSLGQLDVSAAARAAPNRAHLHAIRNRQRTNESVSDDKLTWMEKREPKVPDSLSWRRGRSSAAASSLNKFANDGSFLRQLAANQKKEDDGPSCSPRDMETVNMEVGMGSAGVGKPSEESASGKQELSANQLAARAMQLRMKGKHDEADKLMVEIMKMKDSESKPAGLGAKGSATRHVLHKLSLREKEKVEDADMNLAQTIVHNKQYGREDDEYDFENAVNFAENPTRPKHLVVAIANFTCLMLPQWQPVVQGHCYIYLCSMEAATRNIDNNVWDEIRNFKKCLIMMFFGKQDKDVLFLETVMDIRKQRRHCLVECIPLPDKLQSRPLCILKRSAIDEAEDEWSQHNAKKLIDTSKKDYFGLDKSFVHIIDDESQFKSNIGINVIRGMLQLPGGDMYRRKHAVGLFVKEWEPFDWTKQLG